MLWIEPGSVTLGGVALTGVRAVMINEKASERVIDHESVGRWPTFVDVTGAEAEAVIEREVSATHLPGPRVGEAGTLRFVTRIGATDTNLRTVSASVVVSEVKHAGSAAKGFTQTIKALLVATDAATDPLSVTEGSGA